MPPLHLEPVLDSIVATLRTNLPTVIATQNAEHADFQIEPPAADQVDLSGFLITTYPCVEVAATDYVASALSLGHVDAAMIANVVVRVLFLDADSATIYRRALRYGRAVFTALAAQGALGPYAELARERPVRGSYAFNPEANAAQEAFGTSVVVFSIEMLETLP